MDQVLSLLEDVDSESLGAVLNQFDPERAESYGYGYGDQYGDRRSKITTRKKNRRPAGSFHFFDRS